MVFKDINTFISMIKFNTGERNLYILLQAFCNETSLLRWLETVSSTVQDIDFDGT